MGRVGLLEPILKDGILNTNFFNGRLLSAEDLKTEQESVRARIANVGRAAGAGVVAGLWVEKVASSPPGDATHAAVSVTAGLAVCRAGHALQLPAGTEVALVPEPDDPTGEDAGLFQTCLPPTTSTVVTGAGFYVLALAPASGFGGHASASGLSDPSAAGGCGSRYAVEGVRFKLVKLSTSDAAGGDTHTSDDITSLTSKTDLASLSRLRNLLAHLCLGTPDWLRYPRFETEKSADSFGALAALRGSGGLTDCDVPLALIYWRKDGIAFVDRWSVRRAVEEVAAEGVDPSVAGAHVGYSRAVFAQFEEQVRELATDNTQSALAGKSVADLFAYLPPAGVVPVVAGGSPSGFSQTNFFGSRASGTPTIITAEDMLAYVRQAEAHLPVEVAKTDILQLYWVKENVSAAQAGGGSSQLYMFYTARTLHGASERDKVALTLGQAWKSYAGLLKKSVLLPKTLTADSLPLFVSLLSAQQNVVNYAMSRETAAAERALNRAAAMNAYQGLYDLQAELGRLCLLTFSGDDGLPARQNFSSKLTALLDVKLTNNQPGLKPSLTKDDIHATVAAQQAINTFISSWSGEIAFGHIFLQHSGSPRGETLKPGDSLPFPFVVTVKNNTDKAVTVELSASVVQSTTGTWGDAVKVANESGQPLETLSLNPTQSATVNVMVTAPGDALSDGQLVRVRFNARIPEPTDKTWSLDLDLHTGSEATGEVAYALHPTVIARATGRTNALPDTDYKFVFRTSYTASRAPQQINFTFRVSVSLSSGKFSAGDWQIFFEGRTEQLVQASGLAGTLQCTLPISTSDVEGVPLTVVVHTQPNRPGTGQQVCTFTAEARASFVDPTTGATVNLSRFVEANGATEPFSVTLKSTP